MADIDIKDYSSIASPDWTNDKFLMKDATGPVMGYVTYAQLETQLDTDFVNIDGTQTITGAKSFSTQVRTDQINDISGAGVVIEGVTILNNDITSAASIKSNAFILNGGVTLTTGTYTNTDVDDKSHIIANTAGGNITIQGLANGVTGQIIKIIKTSSSNDLIIAHNNGSGTQKIITQTGADITYSIYTVIELIYTGANWFTNAH